MAAIAGTRPVVLAGVPARLLRTATDERLVALVRGGSEPAFEAIFDRHHRALLSFCRQLVSSHAEAEDAVQQTFLAAYRGLLRSDQPIALRPWLYTIARNQCINTLRSRRESSIAEPDELPGAGDGPAEQVQRRQELRELVVDLRRLPDDQRAALVLFELDDLSHEDIGAVIGVRKEKVKALVFQAREALEGARGARAIPCRDIREQIATARGGALRRAPLRRHIAACDGCRVFRDEVVRQRRAMAAILPVAPSAALKAGSLPWLAGGAGGGAGGAIAGGAAAVTGGAAATGGGGATAGFAGATALASSGLAKALTIGAVAVVGTAGGVVGVKEIRAAGGASPAPAAAKEPGLAKTPAAQASPTAQSPTPPQSPASQGVTPTRRAGKGGNAAKARERAKTRKRGRSETAPGRTKPKSNNGNGSSKEKGKPQRGAPADRGRSNGKPKGDGSAKNGGGSSNAGGNGKGNGPPATRPAPAAPEPAAAPPASGNANSNGNGAVNGGGAKSNGKSAKE